MKIGIASSDNEKSIRATAQHLGITALVDFFCGYDTGHGAKPSPGMVLGYCAHIGCDAANVAVVGDNRHDMEMALAARTGARIGVLSGTGTRETLAPLADICIESVAFLPDLMAQEPAN
jgi:phosphoglycolate phosphatase